jgi:hypothetical protein
MDKKPYIGQMDRLIQIIEKVKTKNEVAEVITSENVLLEPWANMKDVSGSEDVEGKIRHLVNRTYTIRYNPVVKEKSNKLVINDEGTRFEVLHVIEIGRKSHLEIRVKAYE